MKEFENYIVLALEHAKGGTLTDLIKSRQQGGITLSEDECSLIMKGVLKGLSHIHRNNYVHRDLKPSNIVIDDVLNLESVKLVDFGLAIKF
jgi:serine/threonine protein kinase